MTELANGFAVSIPAISQHLRVLREVGLVKVRQAGRQRFYRLHAKALQPVHEWVVVYEEFCASASMLSRGT